VVGLIDAGRLRSMFLAFFAERGHVIIPSASLIAEATLGPVHHRRRASAPAVPARPTPSATTSWRSRRSGL
jgi:hypothetical protein